MKRNVYAEKSCMNISLYYDHKQEIPLILSAEAGEKDAVTLIRYPHRVELFVNGKLMDEEWPCGRFLKMETEPALFEVESIICEEEPEKILPAVTNVFTDAEGWMPEDPVIPCESVPKAAVFNGSILFTGFKRIGNYAGTLTFREAKTAENGEMRF